MAPDFEDYRHPWLSDILGYPRFLQCAPQRISHGLVVAQPQCKPAFFLVAWSWILCVRFEVINLCERVLQSYLQNLRLAAYFIYFVLRVLATFLGWGELAVLVVLL